MTPITIEQALQIATGHQQAGRVVEAEAICRQILDRLPDQIEALHLLGIVLHAAGRRDEAIASYRRIVELEPDLVEAHNNLGRTLCEQGRFDEAIAALSRAVQRARIAQPHNNLGVALHAVGRRDEALAACRRAIELKPDYASAHHNLGAVLHAAGRRDEAIVAYRRAFELKPDDAKIRNTLELALQEASRPDVLPAADRHAGDLIPDPAEACNDHGTTPYEKSRVKSLLVVSATRHDAESFFSTAPLGLSLKRLAFDTRVTSAISFLNVKGLPIVFNAQINETNRSKLLLFIHDDVWIDDYFIVDRVLDAVNTYDLVGVAGNTRRLTRQVAWTCANEQFDWDDQLHLTGAVAHGENPFGKVVFFGPAPRACRLLDGVFLAAPCDVLLDRGVFFDDRFSFHFYDMDFCRTAEARGLRLGSWPIAITHVSGGGCDTPSWQDARAKYLEKWTE